MSDHFEFHHGAETPQEEPYHPSRADRRRFRRAADRQNAEPPAAAPQPGQGYNILATIVLGGVFVAIAALLLLLERPTISGIEQRKLAVFPTFSLQSYFAGEYTTGISKWYDDTVPERDNLKRMASNIANLFGLRVGGTKFYGVASLPDSSSSSDPQPSASASQPGSSQADTSASASPAIPPDDPAGLEMEDGLVTNGILILRDWGIMLYGGSFGVGENYANSVNAYKRDLGSGVAVYSMAIPTSVAYYLPEKYASYTASQKENFDNISSFLSDDVVDVDVYTALLAHVEEDIYTRTDHHWAALGAYYAAQQFATQAGVPFPALSTYQKVAVDGYVGTLYAYTQDAALLGSPEEFVYYIPQTSYTTTYYDMDFTNPYEGRFFQDFTHLKGSLYCTYMGGDSKLVHIKTSCNNGRKLMVLKESYGNALIPFLFSSFEEIYVVDIRYFELNAIDFAKQHDITDLLFANCAFTVTGGNAKHFERLRTLDAVATVAPSSSAASLPEDDDENAGGVE